MRRTMLLCGLLFAGLIGSACSNEARLTALVDYDARDCNGLGHEFGRHLNEEIMHIGATGKAKYYKLVRPGQPKGIRQLLAWTEGETRDLGDLRVYATAGHLEKLSQAMRELRIGCSLEQLATSSEPTISEKVQSTLLASLNQFSEAPKPASTWREWWDGWYALGPADGEK